MKIMHQVKDFLDFCKQTIHKNSNEAFQKPNERFLKKNLKKSGSKRLKSWKNA